ncbi:hypothetical protein GCM10010517_61270 [Streptosporangium fragile]|uniref:DUF3618 domain-containing protein n=1 Tax=Streptosporangium fragile TaxID=46186 RepID=A0ABP6IPQ2_9ACTN
MIEPPSFGKGWRRGPNDMGRIVVPRTLFAKRNVKIVVPENRLNQVKVQAARAADRVGPMAVQARDAASHARDAANEKINEKIIVARGWAAPKLDAAAHSIEDQLAPKLSAMMSQAAARIDPTPTARSRKWPVMLLLTGIAIGAAGLALYRRNAEQWADTLKEGASETSQWVGEKTESAAGKISGTTSETASATESKAGELGGKVDATADQVSNTKKTP